jgi:O-methyltransferase involved in polyketide biosynthesis
MSKIKLSPTAALVMHWMKDCYSCGKVKNYIDNLDLTPGDALHKQCHEICDWYSEVIVNRKFLARKLIEEKLLNAEIPYQVIILAAGKTPLSLELYESSRNNIERIFEVDIAGLDEKKEILTSIEPDINSKVSFIESDLNKLNNIEDYGVRRDLPSIVLLEGVSYYLPKETLETVINLFKSPHGHNTFIAEYMVPLEKVILSRREMPLGIFEAISMSSGLNEMQTYTKYDIFDFYHTLFLA